MMLFILLNVLNYHEHATRGGHRRAKIFASIRKRNAHFFLLLKADG